MPIINDDEFGAITVRRSARARSVRIRLAPNGQLRASLPLYAPLLLVKRLLKNSRPAIRQLLLDQQNEINYEDGMQIGKSHTLVVVEALNLPLQVSTRGQQIIVRTASKTDLSSPAVKSALRPVVIAALRREAKSYLPRRLKFLADKYGYSYANVRFSHASSRWGSCSSNGTISINIALINLPFELIDYVLLHELAHTKQMNHSSDFWNLVKKTDPEYEQHRKDLKSYSTSI